MKENKESDVVTKRFVIIIIIALALFIVLLVGGLILLKVLDKNISGMPLVGNNGGYSQNGDSIYYVEEMENFRKNVSEDISNAVIDIDTVRFSNFEITEKLFPDADDEYKFQDEISCIAKNMGSEDLKRQTYLIKILDENDQVLKEFSISQSFTSMKEVSIIQPDRHNSFINAKKVEVEKVK